MRSLGVALLVLLSVGFAEAQTRVQLTCNILAVAGVTEECQGGGFPYTVPAGSWLCVTDHLLVNKFPYDPPAYGTNMRSMYFMVWGLTVAAHHPQVSLVTPYAYPPGTIYRGWISNGMSEDQYVYGIITGYLSSNSNCTK